MSKTKVKVTQDDKKPVPIEVIAESIKNISEGIKKLRSGPLNDSCLTLLIQNAAPSVGRYKKITQQDIRAVLSGIESLEREYLK